MKPFESFLWRCLNAFLGWWYNPKHWYSGPWFHLKYWFEWRACCRRNRCFEQSVSDQIRYARMRGL